MAVFEPFGVIGKKAQLSQRPGVNGGLGVQHKPFIVGSSGDKSSTDSQAAKRSPVSQTPATSVARSRQVSFSSKEEISSSDDEKKAEKQYEKVPAELIATAISELVQGGVLLDFKSNPQIKHTSNPDSGATTENPGKVGFTRDNAVIYVEGKESRTKMIKYGNFNAIHEVLAQKLYELVGLKSPHTKLMVGLDGVFADKIHDKVDAEKNKQSGVPNLYVSSPIVPGYQDLGDFLLNGAQYFLDSKQKVKWEEEKMAISKLKKSKAVDGEIKRKILHHHFAIYEMLPDYIHTEIEKSFAAGKFIANWDFANFDLKNIGCRFVLEGIRDHIPVKFESVFVDFGNSGVLGFGGKVKELSAERANTEAKPAGKNPADSDPALAFNEEEKKFLNSIGDGDLQRGIKAMNRYDVDKNPDKKQLLSSIYFKLSHQISTEEASHEISNSVGFLTISDLPRNLPFGALFRQAVQQKAEAILDGDITKPKWRDGEIEMAFRLSLVRDETIEAVVNKWNLCDRFPEVFACPEGADPAKYSSHLLVKAFIERKHHLVNSVPNDVVNQWVFNNPYLAIDAQRQVLLGNLDVVKKGDLESVLQKENLVECRASFNSSDQPKVQSDEKAQQKKPYSFEGLKPSFIKSMIEARIVKDSRASDKISVAGFREYQESLEAVRALKSVFAKLDLEQKKLLEAPLRILSDVTNGRQLRVAQKNLEDVLSYVEKNSKRFAKFSTTPNCSFFDIKILRETYRKNYGESFKKEDGKIRTSNENDTTNAVRHKENQWVFDQFIKALDLCSDLELCNRAKHPTFSALSQRMVEAKTI